MYKAKLNIFKLNSAIEDYKIKVLVNIFLDKILLKNLIFATLLFNQNKLIAFR